MNITNVWNILLNDPNRSRVYTNKLLYGLPRSLGKSYKNIVTDTRIVVKMNISNTHWWIRHD